MWDVFHRTPSRGGRGRRAAVDFVVWLECGGSSCFCFVVFLRTHTTCGKYARGRLASFTSVLARGDPFGLIYLCTSTRRSICWDFFSRISGWYGRPSMNYTDGMKEPGILCRRGDASVLYDAVSRTGRSRTSKRQCGVSWVD